MVCACLKAWHGFAPRLPLRLVETNGQTNEPLKASLICPMALLENQDGGVAEGEQGNKDRDMGVGGVVVMKVMG